MSEIICKNIKVTYIINKKQFIDGLNGLSINFINGRVNILFGSNGCGKTTLLNCIAGFLPYDGEILIDNKDANTLSIIDRNISYVTQQINLFPKLTIFDNLAFPLKNKKMDIVTITKKIYNILEDFGISHLMNCLPNQISIGQAQRVYIAKALLNEPEILILDEAFSNIDKPNTRFIQDKIKKYVKDNNINVIYVVHDKEDALYFGDYFYLIDNNSVINEGDMKKLVVSDINK